jgi:hypothetical protein
MMFSDLVRLIDGLLNINPMALFVLLPFTLVLWFAWKLMQAFVLNGHWFILAGVGLVNFALVSALLKDGNAMGALAFSAILCFIGHEAYRRLIQSR